MEEDCLTGDRSRIHDGLKKTLQLIFEQLNELCAGHKEIKNNARRGQEELRNHVMLGLQWTQNN
jgi:hypothetical protein